MSVTGLPLGAQVMGLPGQDTPVTALARWLIENLQPVIG